MIYTHPLLSIYPSLLLHHVHPCTLSHHPSILPLFLPRVLSPLLHTLNVSHHLCSAFHPFILCCLSPAVYSSLSPDITSNHILNSSLQSSLSTHPSLPVSSSLFSSPLLQILDQDHYLNYVQYTHRNQSWTGHVQESVSVTLMERRSADSVTVQCHFAYTGHIQLGNTRHLKIISLLINLLIIFMINRLIILSQRLPLLWQMMKKATKT